MRRVKISEICEQIRGVSYKPTDVVDSLSGIPILRANNISDDVINYNNLVYIKKERISPKQILKKGDILICTSSGSKNLVGKAGLITKGNFISSFGAFCKVLRAYNTSSEYLFHYFCSDAYRDRISALSAGANINNIKNEHIDTLEIPIYPLDKERNLLKVLNKTKVLISKRKQQLSKLDELAKSRFIEMFGRCSEDKFGWGLKTLEDCCVINPQKTTDSRLKPGLEVSFCPMPYISEKGEIKTDDIIIYDKVKSGFTYFAENDVLFAKITPCMENGKGAIARNLKNGIGFGSTEFHVLRPKKEMITPEWLYFLTTFQQFRKDAENNMTGSAGQRRVPVNFLKKYRVSVPPKSLQYEFTRLLQQLDKSKFGIKKSLEKLELTYKALLQEYFG